jgi:ribonuclease T2
MNLASRVRIAAAAALIFGVLASCPQSADAQDAAGKDCILDHCADKAPPAAAVPQAADAVPSPQETGPAFTYHGAIAPGAFDFYVLALSWSPGFCETGGAAKAREQCAAGANLGFVVHGLWPQNTHGYPSNCGPSGRYPSRIALQATKGLYPDEGLARHEWSLHGTCSGKSPTDYFADVRRARETITIPPPLRAPRQQQRWAAIDIQRAFIAANPRLRPGMMSVECARSVLSEVRICFAKDLRNFVACPEVARHFCFGREMTVPAIQ